MKALMIFGVAILTIGNVHARLALQGIASQVISYFDCQVQLTVSFSFLSSSSFRWLTCCASDAFGIA